MSSSPQIRAAWLAVIAGSLSLGGALALALPIQTIFGEAGGVADAPSKEVNKMTTSPAIIEQGHQFFTMSCVECHADDAHGDEGPDLHNLTISDARIAVTIRKGVKGEMPSFAKKYDDSQISALVAFLRSLK